MILRTLFSFAIIKAFFISQSHELSPTKSIGTAAEQKPTTTVHMVKKFVQLSLLPKWLEKKAPKNEKLFAVVNGFKNHDSAHLSANAEKLAHFIGEFGFYSLVEDKLMKEIVSMPQSCQEFFKKFLKKIDFTQMMDDYMHYQELKAVTIVDKHPKMYKVGTTVNVELTVIRRLAGLLYYGLMYQALLYELGKPKNSVKSVSAEKKWLKNWLTFSLAAIRAEFNVAKYHMENGLHEDKFGHKMLKTSPGRKFNDKLAQKLAEWNAKIQKRQS